MKKYTLYIIAAFAVVLFASCNNGRTGKIEGTISQAEGKLLILEHLTDGAPRMVDTLRLDATGKFEFAPVVENGPDFFSLRVGNQSATIAIDTLLTPVQFTASADKLANEYEVADEQNKELKAAVLAGNLLRRQVVNLAQSVNGGKLTRAQGRDSLAVLVENYKSGVLADFIYQNPASAASYIILHETVDGMLVFDPAVSSDLRAFGAVATSWLNTYPNSPRTKNLEQMALQGQRMRHEAKVRAAEQDSIISNLSVAESGYPNLNLRNADDHYVSVSSLVDGKNIVLVDFTAYALKSSPSHNIILSNIYNKYAGKGVKIYQVCLDFDENFWKTSADNLPWTTVRDEEVLFDAQGNLQYSPTVNLYNVQTLPTTYIIDQKGEIKVRVEDDTKLEAELRKVVK